MTNEHVIAAIHSHWDKATNILWFNVRFVDGYNAQIGIPLAHVVATLDFHMAELGIEFGPVVGDIESVDGLFSGIKKAAKKIGKPVTSAVSKTAKTLDRSVSAAAKVIKNKQLNIAMQGARFVPVVGQTAYAVHQTAKRAVEGYEQGKAAASIIARTGKSSAGLLSAVAKGRNIQQALTKLKQSADTPEARMLVQALNSMP